VNKRSIEAVLAFGLVAGLPGLAGAQAATPWLHVRVEEPQRQSKVHVNLPLSVVEAVLRATPQKLASEGRIHFGPSGKTLSIPDLRRIWTELRAAGDSELVSVEEKDETVKVARRGDLVEVRIDKPGDKETLRVEVPVGVVDALLSGSGETLELEAAFAEMRKRRGEIVRVDDEDSTVRVWIDEKN
jgi:hypothetical protein